MSLGWKSRLKASQYRKDSWYRNSLGIGKLTLYQFSRFILICSMCHFSGESKCKMFRFRVHWPSHLLNYWSTNHCWTECRWSGVSNETNEDVRMYIEEFILVDIWIHCCTSWNWICIGNAVVYIQSQQWKRNVRIALRSQLTSED